MAVTPNTTNNVTDKVATMAHDAINRVAANAAEAEARIKKAAADAEEQLLRSTRKAQQRSNELAHTVGEYTQQHPLASIGIAFAAGFLLSSLFRR